ncbi:MAG: glycosyltransferase family 4 protein [Rhodobacteraceae bacterium]|nr:glycosyltransferase family 4 protein [Paracoccaceae bacterium]
MHDKEPAIVTPLVGAMERASDERSCPFAAKQYTLPVSPHCELYITARAVPLLLPPGTSFSMRIAHLMSHSALNGVATSVKTLIEEQLRAGHEVMLVHRNGSWIERQTLPKCLPILGTSFKTTPAEIRRVGYAIREWGAKVVHTHGSRANKYGMVYRCVAGTPVVMTAHCRQFQLPWMFAHAVIAPSHQTARYYLKRCLVRHTCMHRVSHLFTVTTVEAANDERRKQVRSQLGMDREAFLIGSVGSICARKNQVEMVKLLARLVDAGVKAELVLVGDTDQAESLPGWSDWLARPELASRVHLLGQREDATRMMQCMDVYLCTSKVEEGPIATLEALASALPVVTVDVGAACELIDHDRNGGLFPISAMDAMTEYVIRLAGAPALRAALGSNARSTIAEQLAPAKIIPQVNKVYRAAMARAGVSG